MILKVTYIVIAIVAAFTLGVMASDRKQPWPEDRLVVVLRPSNTLDLQSAVDLISGGGTIYLPKGTFSVGKPGSPLGSGIEVE